MLIGFDTAHSLYDCRDGERVMADRHGSIYIGLNVLELEVQSGQLLSAQAPKVTCASQTRVEIIDSVLSRVKASRNSVFPFHLTHHPCKFTHMYHITSTYSALAYEALTFLRRV